MRKENEKKNGCTVIAGCGRLGASIAGKLSEESKDVVIIDKDSSAFRKLPHSYGGLTMAANAADMDRLNAVGLREASAFIVVTDHYCVNICAAQIAKEMFQVPKVVARIYDEEKLSLVQEMGIDAICPSELSEKEIAHYIEMGGTSDVEQE